MSAAWETTREDVSNVITNNGYTVDDYLLDEIHSSIDTNMVEKEALRGDDMSEQTDYAYKEIWEQILNNGYF